jgi:hypothetical protein
MRPAAGAGGGGSAIRAGLGQGEATLIDEDRNGDALEAGVTGLEGGKVRGGTFQGRDWGVAVWPEAVVTVVGTITVCVTGTWCVTGRTWVVMTVHGTW